MSFDFEQFKHDWRRQGYRFYTTLGAYELCLARGLNKFAETGTMRRPWNRGLACSTIISGEFLKGIGGGHLTTIDISAENIKNSKHFSAHVADYITYVTADSVETLKNLEGPIDFLYLDSYDMDTEHPCEDAANHQLEEIKAAWDKLHVNSVILLDDNIFNWPNKKKKGPAGKTFLAVPYLLDNGWVVLRQGHQVLLVRADSEYTMPAKPSEQYKKSPLIIMDWFKPETFKMRPATKSKAGRE